MLFLAFHFSQVGLWVKDLFSLRAARTLRDAKSEIGCE